MKTIVSVLGLVLTSAAISGCVAVSWASYPAAPGETAIKDPNTPAMEEIMLSGLRWTVTKYPPIDGQGHHVGNGRIAINLPPGVKPKVYRRCAEYAGGGAEPVTEANKSLPTFHVTSIRVRGDEGQITIVWPAASLGPSPSGGPVYQEVKLGLQGSLAGWRVSSFREWGPGAEAPPLNFYVPEPDYVPPPPPAKPTKVPSGP